jgi:hypothetical protein
MMKRSPTSSVPRRRDWYSVPAGSLKVIGVLVLAAAAFAGYRYWERSAQEARAQRLLADCTARVERLGAADARRQHPRLWEQLEGARAALAAATSPSPRISAGGASLTLRPGTMVHLDAQLTDLAFGDVELATAAEERTVATPGARARFERGSEAQFSVADDGATSRVMVAAGGAEVTTDAGETRRLAPLEQVVRESGRWSAVTPVLGRPQLVEPADRRSIDPAAGEVALAWEAIDGARGYRLQVAAGPLFTDSLVDDERTAPAALLRIGETGSFFWRVAAVDERGDPGPWSRPRSFRAGSGPAASGDRVARSTPIQTATLRGRLQGSRRLSRYRAGRWRPHPWNGWHQEASMSDLTKSEANELAKLVKTLVQHWKRRHE